MNTQLQALQRYMKSHQLDGFIIPSSDPHQSEYVSDHWKLREYFSGFTGSAGTLVVTQKEAALWTDSRYFLQVEQECHDKDIDLHKQSIPHAPEHIPWLCNLLQDNAVIGIDFRQFSKAQIDYLKQCAGPKHIQLHNKMNFADHIWPDRPSVPNAIINDHPTEYSGEPILSKLEKVQNQITNFNADYYFLSSLDEIAWLFNIRSQDVDFTPLVIAYALVGHDHTYLFCDVSRLSESVLAKFHEHDIIPKAYSTVFDVLSTLPNETTIVTDPSTLNYAVFEALKERWVFQDSVVRHLKSIKNPIEIEGEKTCMIKDGVALTQFFIWLEKLLETDTITEYEIGRELENFRKLQENYVGESFAAIVGYKANGAIIHYTAPEVGSSEVSKDGILLIDSGAQYKDGTTDITRTLWLGGDIPKAIKTAYTSVLKGYIELEQLQFPMGTTGVQIDAFARMHLWKNGLDYLHGTGHGVGSFGMVHEPEQGFATSTTTVRGRAPHLPNQFTTIEPGCYVEGEFGIRIENIVISKVVSETDFNTFLGFEPLTLCYIDTQLIDLEMLTENEIDWMNNYHNTVLNALSPYLKDSEVQWLSIKCQPISK